jgi:hypothetical protein
VAARYRSADLGVDRRAVAASLLGKYPHAWGTGYFPKLTCEDTTPGKITLGVFRPGGNPARRPTERGPQLPQTITGRS